MLSLRSTVSARMSSWRVPLRSLTASTVLPPARRSSAGRLPTGHYKKTESLDKTLPSLFVSNLESRRSLLSYVSFQEKSRSFVGRNEPLVVCLLVFVSLEPEMGSSGSVTRGSIDLKKLLDFRALAGF